MPFWSGVSPCAWMYCMSLRLSLCQCLQVKHGFASAVLGICTTPVGPFGVATTVGARHPVSWESFAMLCFQHSRCNLSILLTVAPARAESTVWQVKS
jgi:hypothetical protein